MRFTDYLLFTAEIGALRSTSVGFSVPISKTEVVAVKMHVPSQQHTLAQEPGIICLSLPKTEVVSRNDKNYNENVLV